MGSFPESVAHLVKTFADQGEQYTTEGYNETQCRIDFINPMFKALGWDMDNTAGYAEAYREVIHEDALKIGSATKAPDYSFRIGGTRKFFLEAKKPAVAIATAPDSGLPTAALCLERAAGVVGFDQFRRVCGLRWAGRAEVSRQSVDGPGAVDPLHAIRRAVGGDRIALFAGSDSQGKVRQIHGNGQGAAGNGHGGRCLSHAHRGLAGKIGRAIWPS